MTDSINKYMLRHRMVCRHIKDALDCCDGNVNTARRHYFNIDALVAERTKLEVILLVHVPQNFLQNQINSII